MPPLSTSVCLYVAMEVFRRLVLLPVFNTGVARHPGQAGSIPVHLRSPRTATATVR